MNCRFAFLMLALFSIIRTAPAQVRDVLELGQVVKGILQIRVDWGSSFGFRPRFVGDVDGDGFGDFVVRHGDRDAVLVYGAPQDLFTSPAILEDTRHSKFVGNDVIFAFESSFAGLGDIDRDGYDDFLLASPGTPRGDFQAAGVVLLIFGAADFSDQVRLGSLEESGVRSLRFVSEEELRLAGQFVSSAGDLNADGHVDFAIRESAGGTENGGEGAGRIYVIFGGFDVSKSLGCYHIQVYSGSSLRGTIRRRASEEWLRLAMWMGTVGVRSRRCERRWKRESHRCGLRAEFSLRRGAARPVSGRP